MSPRLRALSGRDVVRILRQFGFEMVATRGRYAKLRRILENGQRQTLTIPLHAALATGTAHAIFRQACRYVAESKLRTFFFAD